MALFKIWFPHYQVLMELRQYLTEVTPFEVPKNQDGSIHWTGGHHLVMFCDSFRCVIKVWSWCVHHNYNALTTLPWQVVGSERHPQYLHVLGTIPFTDHFIFGPIQIHQHTWPTIFGLARWHISVVLMRSWRLGSLPSTLKKRKG